MKRLNLLVTAFCLTVSLSSQPIISNDVWIDLGESESIQFLDIDDTNFNPGPAGINVEWDHRGLPVDDYVCFYEAFDIRLSTQADSFPNADHFYICQTSNESGEETETSIFYSHKNNRVSVEGTFIRSISNPNFDSLFNVYTDPLNILEFPIEYQDSFSDDYSVRLTNHGEYELHAQIDGTITTTADAYGTLRTDAGEFKHVLRLNSTEIIELSTPGSPYTVINEKNRYSWLSPSENYFLLTLEKHITYDLTGNPIPDITQYSGLARISEPSSVFSTDNELGISVYPNPASDRLFIHSSDELGNDSYYVIRDISGRQIVKGDILKAGLNGDGLSSIDIVNLPVGTFFLQIYNGENTLSKTIPVFKAR